MNLLPLRILYFPRDNHTSILARIDCELHDGMDTVCDILHLKPPETSRVPIVRRSNMAVGTRAAANIIQMGDVVQVDGYW